MTGFAPPPGGSAALVTGAAQGIGLALAAALAADGWRVVLADVNGDQVSAAADRLPGARAVALDVTDAGAVAATVAAVEEVEPLLLLVNNAGVGPRGADRGLYPLAEWNRVVAVNLLGVVHGVNAAYPRMRDRGGGVILNVASLAGLVAGPGLGPYAATKHAVVGLTLGLRADAAPFGVRVSALCPSWVDTAILDGEAPDGKPVRAHLKEFGLGEPIPPAEIARIALEGLRRNRALVVAPRAARQAWWAHRLAPGLVERRSRRVAAVLARQYAAAGSGGAR
jgi:NAD(P)-dependent dehydrogenase (short-subunit alcohol dehydrogenase family)